jgi:hypothetical protein
MAGAAGGAAGGAEKAGLEQAEATAEVAAVKVQVRGMDPDRDTARALATAADREPAQDRARGRSPA